MAALLLVIQDASASASQLARDVDRSDRRRSMRAVLTYIQRIISGAASGYVTSVVASTFATRNVTCSQAGAVDGTDELTVAGTVLAVEAAPATESEFLKGASNAAFATNLAAAINAHSVLSKIVRAKATAAVVAITSKIPGPIGNLITLAETGNGFTLAGAALTGGASDEADGYPFGYDPSL
jgi:hypothetical protein